ncbi:hypothetical protein WOLCODRAFT_166185 [Wolfiporia cocos MD-104 SS10]|uniref:Uncharacterized protein n=1 Tax=Wolfiporia cocos (strain MD-104) TaxID=742152 RepID=A0A2H3J968_WOLCO|nr:hypothetical protein WOLCODRAFT_166185 [Wolfiporia cocos MD-104 SS10]
MPSRRHYKIQPCACPLLLSRTNPNRGLHRRARPDRANRTATPFEPCPAARSAGLPIRAANKHGVAAPQSIAPRRAKPPRDHRSASPPARARSLWPNSRAAPLLPRVEDGCTSPKTDKPAPSRPAARRRSDPLPSAALVSPAVPWSARPRARPHRCALPHRADPPVPLPVSAAGLRRGRPSPPVRHARGDAWPPASLARTTRGKRRG